MPAALALVADYHRGSTRSLATGVLLGGVIVGAGLGGLGGWLAERQGWSYAFKLFGLLGVAYSLVLVFLLCDVPREGGNGDTPAESLQAVQLREAIRSLFGSVAFILVLTYWGLLGLAGWMVVGRMPTYFQEHFHLTQGTAGVLATVYLNVATLVGFVAGGAWVDRWSFTNKRACIVVSVIGLCAAVPGVLLVSYTTLLPVAITGLVLFGFMSSFAGTEMMPILCLISDPRYRATGFGIVNLFSCLVGGATIYAGGALRDAQVDISNLFKLGAVGLAVCAGLLLFVKPRPGLTH
jgi:MFS family permease